MRSLVERFTRVEQALGPVEEAVAIALVVAMAVVVNLQIVARYVFHAPFIWPEEVTRLILVWLTFVGAGAVARRSADIAVETFVQMLPPGAQRLMLALRDVVLMLLFGFVALEGHRLARAVADMPLVATEWPTSLLAWPLVVGGSLIAFHAFARLLRVLVLGHERVPG